ncbi:DASH family cryptochrome [Halococcus saccharolyticus]|uniref:Cryptochrome DASH n=1 Tax=Halococcus saccharolyticus DSM 5350 TaxID=1227455 RepID=M0MM17_9EURY|nr:DASH family cryptochrome [Halococcus saccharolyticus]EMA45779.1 deoxyribodipyrimidine photolyase [Halococcus saccharolyticus DSM 5350]
MTDTAVVWFRTDLRTHDNEALVRAVDEYDTVLPVYCFDPREFGEATFGLAKTGPYRAQFLIESVRDLRGSLREAGSDLFVRQGKPENVVSELAAEHGADIVHYHTTPATEERAVEASVTDGLDEHGISSRGFWGKTLYHIEDLPTRVERIDDTFTPWRRTVEDGATVRDPLDAPTSVTLPETVSDAEGAGDEPGTIPTPGDLGIEEHEPDERAAIDFAGGESAGLRRLTEYVWEGDHLREYKETRNGLLDADYSSKFSAWLALGCLSPRLIHEHVERYECERISNDSTYWLVFELLWRDFMTFQFEKHGSDFFMPTGIRDIEKSWQRDEAAFERWAAGETGVPFVDANMRELNETGFMSNRGRQNVASFLADALGIDWRLGAAYFESRLVDYDVCSNWGNWAYQAGVGNDSRDGYFDVLDQGKRYDPNAAYIRHWLPELDALPADACHEPWQLSPGQQEMYDVELDEDYPEPMINVEAVYDQLDG